MGAKKVLITGGDGYLGSRLARKYLESSDDSILLWVRASDEGEFRAKSEKLSRSFEGYGSRVSCLSGDLASDEPFAALDSRDVRAIIHSAAVTRFNVDEATARAVNVEGAEKLFRFAEGCPALEELGLLSTAYASGLKPGLIEEAPLDGLAGFANLYEQSKWAAERELLTRFGHLPWRVFRVATIIADDESGRVTQFNAFHNTLKLFYYGLLSLVPGEPETPLYFVTGQFVADAVFELMNNSRSAAIYHVAHSAAESITLGGLIALAFEAFEAAEDFKLRRVLKPLYSDAESFDLLADGVSAFGGGIVNQAVSSVAPFNRQLFVRKEICNRRLVEALSEYRAPDARQLIRNTCDYLVRTRWGRL